VSRDRSGSRKLPIKLRKTLRDSLVRTPRRRKRVAKMRTVTIMKNMRSNELKGTKLIRKMMILSFTSSGRTILAQIIHGKALNFLPMTLLV
jgi:hypothetical protein